MTEQEPDPPETLLGIRAALVLLADLRDRLEHPDDEHDDPDLIGRIAALHGALRRIRARLETEGP